MKTKEKILEQYLYHGTDDNQENIDSFLKKTAPLIGYIIQRFNTLEKSLDSVLCFILHKGTDEFGLLIINKMSFSAKVELLDRFSTQFQNIIDAKIPVFKDIITNLREVGKLRNAVAHSDWESTDFEGYTYKNLKISSKGIIQEYIQFTPESLKKILSKISETNLLFDEYDYEWNKPRLTENKNLPDD